MKKHRWKGFKKTSLLVEERISAGIYSQGMFVEGRLAWRCRDCGHVFGFLSNEKPGRGLRDPWGRNCGERILKQVLES